MLKNKNFIVFSDDWGRHPFSCQHIMQHLLPHNKLLWVNTIGMRTPKLNLYDIKRAFGKVASWLRPEKIEGAIETHPNLRIISPFMIPYNNYTSIREFNAKSVIKAVQTAATEWNFQDPILLTTQPLAADYCGKLGENLVVYYCVDDFVHWPGMNQPKLVQGLEDSLLEKSDLVFAVSDSLCNSRYNGKNRTELLTHGVDISHFAKASVKEKIPEELAHLTGPIIGFYGLIDQRFDIELIQTLLESRPEWNIICIGNSIIDISSLIAFKNFHHLQAVSYENLPNYAACFDVAFIPYVVNELTHSINPLKLREYIATGKPIVTTPMNEVFRFQDVINIAEKGEAFISSIENALTQRVDEDLRAKSLVGESWKDKAELVSEWIEVALRKKHQAEEKHE